MPFNNFESRHFSAAEKTTINNAVAALETALTDKLANLNAEERGRLGSINEQNKLIVNKVRDYRLSQPTLSSPDVDWTEFLNDFDSRVFIQNLMMRLDGLLQSLENAKILHDWDNYQAALTDYDYAKYKVGTQALGYETKLEEIKQFFSRTGISGGNDTPPLTPEG
ncbi:MAG: hypothetical protein IPL35_07360 [Sphingobacteriales bacterium]|nr:hypothetical protein [Sphingobacteriales bacterium]